MHHLNSISVLGCGWLGFPLATGLINYGYNVKGSTTSIDKLRVLFEAGIDPFLVQFPDACGSQNLVNFLQSDTLILAVPPGRDQTKQTSYFGLINALAQVLPESSIKHIVFISSTSVYGESNSTINELDEPVPDTDAGKRMLLAEQIISAIPVRKSLVRLSGLVGPGRHPGRFLAGKTQVPNGLAPVNLIHLNDAVGIILKILSDEGSEGVYNATAPLHPSKADFYSLASISLGLEAPQFIMEKRTWKEIESVRISRDLNYTFQTPDLMEWLIRKNSL